eukprot:scaffold152226_cov41-Attheya_sp.AAC.2
MVGKPWTSRTEREPFEAFLSKFLGRNGDKTQEISGGTQGKRKNQRGKETRARDRRESEKNKNKNKQSTLKNDF